MIDKISKLLVQAERASTAEEADAFFSKAQLLASANSIALAEARAHTAKREQRERPVRRSYIMGDVGRNTKKHLVRLFLVIGESNDVVLDVAMDSSTVYPYGLPSDLDVVEAMYAAIAPQMVRAADEYIRSGKHKRSDRKVDGRVARTSFYDAYVLKIKMRLAAARSLAVKEAESNGTGTELVLADKSREIRDFYKAATTATGRWNGPNRSGFSAHASAAGSRAGENARLREQAELDRFKELPA